MTAGIYPRERVEDVLTKIKLPASYRIMKPEKHEPVAVDAELSNPCKERPDELKSSLT